MRLFRSIRIALLGLLFPIHACTKSAPADSLSPGEIPVAAEDSQLQNRRGEANEALRAIAIVENAEHAVLLTQFMRLGIPKFGDSPSASGPSGGRLPISEARVEGDLIPRVASRAGVSPETLKTLFFQGLFIDNGWVLGPQWALPYAESARGDTMRETAIRGIEQTAGAPARLLREKWFWYDAESRTAWFRFEYTGSAGDVLLVNDPQKGQSFGYSVRSDWVTKDDPRFVLLMAYIRIVDRLGAAQASQLFNMKE